MSSGRINKVLVTGGAGFIGRHLLEYLRRVVDGPGEIYAIDQKTREADDDVHWICCDLADAEATAEAIGGIQPDGVIHLAGMTQGSDLHGYFVSNVQCCENLLAAVSQLRPAPMVVVAGTAAQYGLTSTQDRPVAEDHPLNAVTPYGISKTIQEQWALCRHSAGEVPVCCTRLFNVIGPGQGRGLVPAAFLGQILDVVEGRKSEIEVGNLETQRDYTDVRDVARAFWALLAAGDKVGGQVFNIASGKVVSISDILEECLALGGRSVPVRQDTARFKSGDVKLICGDPGRLSRGTGWRPEITWKQSLRDAWGEMIQGNPSRVCRN